MRKTCKGLFSLLLIVAIVASLLTFSTSAASSEPAKYSKEYNSGQRGVVCTTLSGTSAGSYYSGTYTYDSLSQMNANTLKSSLRSLMKSTHTYDSSDNDCHYMANQTDCENENGKDNKLLLLYTSYTATQSQWNGWNREHVWPQSLGGGNTSGGGADLHHIRPSDAGVNSSRGNKKYGESGANATSKYGSNPATGYLGGTYNSTYFEPNDNVKGDVARICLYVLVRWGSDWGADSITEVFQSVDVLLEWCELDPVDTWEMGRNEVIQAIQGNRNVFIDYPEYAWILYDREIPDDMVTPSGMAKAQGGGSDSGDSGNSGNQGGNVGGNENQGGSGNEGGNAGGNENEGGNQGSGNQGGTQQPAECTHPNLKIENQIISCINTGYTGDEVCPDCDYFKEGTFTFPDGKHTVGEVISEDDNGTLYICAVCGEVRHEIIGTENGSSSSPGSSSGSSSAGGSSGGSSGESDNGNFIAKIMATSVVAGVLVIIGLVVGGILVVGGVAVGVIFIVIAIKKKRRK